eukprot:TRINITY_DN8803_c0_g1_i1.p2 TRINITY_DN8803_c0_g1~~TRINITY_DN8803_c0_g1_i1.p2  ORF type:complete len:151 (+),score=9.62 TRINITY_DN8803_c0_g1_i1:233-685(+)
MNSSGSGVRGVKPCTKAKATAQPSATRTSVVGRIFQLVLACLVPNNTGAAPAPGSAGPATPAARPDSPPQPPPPTRVLRPRLDSEDMASPPPDYPHAGVARPPRVAIPRPTPGPFAGMNPPGGATATGAYGGLSRTESQWMRSSPLAAGR